MLSGSLNEARFLHPKIGQPTHNELSGGALPAELQLDSFVAYFLLHFVRVVPVDTREATGRMCCPRRVDSNYAGCLSG